MTAKLVEAEDKFGSDGAMVHIQTESNFNTLDEAMTQAKHDIATNQRIVALIHDDETGKDYTPKDIINYALPEESP